MYPPRRSNKALILVVVIILFFIIGGVIIYFLSSSAEKSDSGNSDSGNSDSGTSDSGNYDSGTSDSGNSTKPRELEIDDLLIKSNIWKHSNGHKRIYSFQDNFSRTIIGAGQPDIIINDLSFQKLSSNKARVGKSVIKKISDTKIDIDGHIFTLS